MPVCPHCNLEVAQLMALPSEFQASVQDADPNFPVDNSICSSCVVSLQRQGSGVLYIQERAKEAQKKKMWQNRVALVKSGNAMMKNKLHSDAAVAYEKYIRLLEMVFNCEPGKLTPEVLKESAKTTELTVIAGVYWDLVRIYDTSDEYGERQRTAAQQLAKFAGFTPIYSDIIRKAQTFMKSARHPEVIKVFLTESKAIKPRCFIATSAFEAPYADEVTQLRQFRDQKLKKSKAGRKFVYFYYKISPSVACFLDKQHWLKPAVRATLRALIKCVS